MAFVKSSKTQNQLLTEYLRGTGRTISAPQASALFGVKNLRARMSDLRQAGYRVSRTENSEGRTAYRIARRMIWQSN
jgi:hypothetical protein